MSQVRDAFQTFSAEGINAALSFFSPDVVWYPTDGWLERAAYRGHDGMRRLEAAFSENFDDFRDEVHDIRDAQDRVVALIDMTGRISPRRAMYLLGHSDPKFTMRVYQQVLDMGRPAPRRARARARQHR
jgi:hypothetical protein